MAPREATLQKDVPVWGPTGPALRLFEEPGSKRYMTVRGASAFARVGDAPGWVRLQMTFDDDSAGWADAKTITEARYAEWARTPTA